MNVPRLTSFVKKPFRRIPSLADADCCYLLGDSDNDEARALAVDLGLDGIIGCKDAVPTTPAGRITLLIHESLAEDCLADAWAELQLQHPLTHFRFVRLDPSHERAPSAPRMREAS